MGFHHSWKPSQRIGAQCLRFVLVWAEQGLGWLQEGWCGCNFPGQLEVQPPVMGQIPLRMVEILEPTLNVDTLWWLIIRIFLMRFLHVWRHCMTNACLGWGSPATLAWHTGTQLPDNFTFRGDSPGTQAGAKGCNSSRACVTCWESNTPE